MKKILVCFILAALGLIASPSLRLPGTTGANFSAAASNQISVGPKLEVTLLVNSGEADQEFDIVSSQEFQLIESFLSGLPEVVPPPDWNGLGWNGYQLLNDAVPNLPEQIRVFQGVVRVMSAGQTHYLADLHGFEGWLAVRAAQQGMTSGLDQLSRFSQDFAMPMPIDKVDAPVVAKDMPTSGSEPPYEPDKWNKPGVQDKNNCYNYARNKILDKFGRPGRGTTSEPPAPGDPGYNCAAFVAGAKADGLTEVDCDKACPAGSFKVALVLDPDGSGGKLTPDYHWYRQDKGGKWSHKPGAGDVTDKDSDGKAITDPRTADRRRKTRDGLVTGYKDFCGCFCVKAS